MLKYALTALLMSGGSIAQAQDGPSYDETVEFIQSKFSSIVNVTASNASIYRRGHLFEEKSQCEFDLVEHRFHHGFQGVTEINVSVFDAKAFDPSRIDRIDYEDGLRVGFRVYTREERPITHFNLGRRDYVSNNGFQSIFPDQGCRGQLNDFAYCAKSPNSNSIAVISTSLVEPRSVNADRLSRAFTHLIRLCGGREELF